MRNLQVRSLRAWLVRLGGFVGRSRRDREFAEEIETHLQMHIDDNLRIGMTPEEARRRALVALGGVEQTKERYRHRRGVPLVDTLAQDVRYAARVLRKNPAFTAVAALVLAFGIGVNTAMFTLVNVLLLQPLEGTHSADLIRLYSQDSQHPDQYRLFSYPDYHDIRQDASVFGDLAAHRLTFVGLTERRETRRVVADVVSANYFSIFGIKGLRGRTFTPDEDTPGSRKPAAIVSFAHWKRTGFDPDLIGKMLRVNAQDLPIVGIAPEGFTGSMVLMTPEVWLPFGLWDLAAASAPGGPARSFRLQDRTSYVLSVFGHLREGLSLKNAPPPLQSLARRLATAYPGADRDQTLLVQRLPRLQDGARPRPEFLGGLSVVLMAMAAIVLLIACLNLANLLLARGVARRHEMAIRLALGASRARIVRQLLVEGFGLALLGGIGGLFFSYWSTTLLMSSIESLAGFLVSFDLTFDGRPDARVLLATMAFCSMSTLLFGLGPSLSATRADVLPELKDQTGTERRVGFFAPRNILVLGQLALSLALVAAGGLFVRAAQRATTADPGYSPEGQLVASVDLGMGQYTENRGRSIYAELVERLHAVPGVQAVALASQVAFSDFTETERVGRLTDASLTLDPISIAVSPDYFRTLGLPILRGRDFTRVDNDPRSDRVAIVDEPLARALWPTSSPVGQSLRLATQPGSQSLEGAITLVIVGVVPGLRHELSNLTPVPHVYVPFGQHYRPAMQLHVRVPLGAERAAVSGVREAIHRVDDRLPLIAVKTLRQVHYDSLNLWAVRAAGRLFTIFGLVALGIAAIGVYGVKSYVVSRRTREIAIRIALGATPRAVLWLVMKEGVWLTALGLTIGLLISAALARALGNLLYDVRALDPLVFVGAAFTLGAAALIASYLPARRVTRIAPLMALRRH